MTAACATVTVSRSIADLPASSGSRPMYPHDSRSPSS
jgi:hypothetical protein